MNLKIFTNIQVVVDYIFSKEIESDIIDRPPDVELIDEEEKIDDEKLDAPVIKDIAGKVDIILSDDECDQTELPSTSKRKAKKLETENPKVVLKKENT